MEFVRNAWYVAGWSSEFSSKLSTIKVVNEEIIFRGCKIHKEPCHKIGRIRDIEIDKSGSIYIITDQQESSLWKFSKKN